MADDNGPTIVGVVLAGGTSSRFGQANKLTAEVDSKPIVLHALKTLLDAPLDDVVVVVGYKADDVKQSLADYPVHFARNLAYTDGLSTSVARGVRAARDSDAIVFLPGDMPDVDPETVELLIDAYRGELGSAVAAAYQGYRGNPVLFDESHFDALRNINGDTGGRSVFLEATDGVLVETDDSGVRRDIDTRMELRHRRES
ncbi:nucleotidyltransferase family protein (plasmid) [Haloarcula sp. NS06]|uniref:nucleotidyltransferase family protein n=1 Tax=Haloarcula sp. NS06 TaxID=3409688 RepID=UPI003DA6D030